MTVAAGPTDHRRRLTEAMAAAVAVNGYRDTTVADVVRLARTSRRSFYEQFADRDACFLALFDDVSASMMEQLAAAVVPEAPLSEQVDAAIDAYLDHVIRQGPLYASFVRELPGLGLAGAERARATLERFAALIVELVEAGRAAQPKLARRPLSAEAAIVLVGGLRELVVISLQRGREVYELRDVARSAAKGILEAALR